MSQSSAVSQPPPMARPLTAAMNGFSFAEYGNVSASVRAPPSRRSPACADSAISLRSPPAEKARPAPVTMPTRMSGSLLKSSIASASWRVSCPPRALSRSGRL